MIDGNSEFYQTFPAPYIENIEKLISAAADADHRVFYRAGTDCFRETAVDFFSAGSFVVHEIPWLTGGRNFDWLAMGDSFKSLDSGRGPLAGYLSYEAGFAFEPNKWQSLRRPQKGFAWRFLQLPCWYEIDHGAKTARICVMNHADKTAWKFLENIVNRVSGGCQITPRSKGEQVSLVEVSEYGDRSQSDYEEAVERVQEDIASGKYYELNLTQRFQMQTRTSPAVVFSDLVNRLSPRRGFFCDFQDEIIVSASPELYLKKTGRRISTRPIKGSISGAVSELEMEKLSAEHIMVVDLARNDLGRVSDRDWVAVEELQVSGQFGKLAHLESLVSGTTSLCWQDIVSKTFPAASITGMPKVIVVQSIEKNETSCRGVYTGACGWVEPAGDFDFNVAIRTLVATADGKEWQYEMGAGGAIVADSIPGDEYLECLRKAQPLISALKRE